MNQIFSNKLLLFFIIIFLSIIIVFFVCKFNKINFKTNLKSQQEFIEDIPPTEDLMREHGILNRVLLSYEEIVKRLDNNKNFKIDNLKQGALIIRNFIEDYHEKLEEQYIFSRFQKAGKLVDLVNSLLDQHKAGRILTDQIIDLANEDKVSDSNNKQKLIQAIKSFIIMYRVHEYREDTELFPAFRSLITQKEFEELADLFEDTEHELFGKEGFQGILKQVEIIEKDLDIYDINKFTTNS